MKNKAQKTQLIQMEQSFIPGILCTIFGILTSVFLVGFIFIIIGLMDVYAVSKVNRKIRVHNQIAMMKKS